MPLLESIAGAGFDRLKTNLHNLAAHAPQVLLLEGGTEAVRLELAMYWLLTVNCHAAREALAAGKPAVPCLDCQTCKQFAANENIDLQIYDGRISNHQDEENPGPVLALRMENIRDLKATLGTRPHGNGKRGIVIQGMSQTREEALNSLLKTLEEPLPHTLFVLLTPQRLQILPTLVSRSFCLTLPWTDCYSPNSEVEKLEESLGEFLCTGRGFLDAIAAKNGINADQAALLLIEIQKALASGLAGESKKPDSSLSRALKPVTKKGSATALLSSWLMEAQEMLLGTVNPARVLEALATRIFTLLRS